MSDSESTETVLLELYKEERLYCIHHENQRSAVCGLVLTAGGACLALLATQTTIDQQHPLLSGLITFIGIIGVALSLKHYERWRFHDNRADALRTLLLERFQDERIRSLFAQADQEHYRRFSVRVPLFGVWTALNLVMVFLGVALFWKYTFSHG